MPARSPRPPPSARVEAALLGELAAVYRDADAALAGIGCPASTECCRFGITGRQPYVTSIELLAVRRAIARRGGAGSWRRASPLEPERPPSGRRLRGAPLPLASSGGEKTCPLLDVAGRCAIYSARPLGCRTYFCDRAAPAGAVPRSEVTALVRRVQEIAVRDAHDGDRGRPLLAALAGPAPRRRGSQGR